MTGTAVHAPVSPSEAEALDAYSTVVTEVAEHVLPSVTSVRVDPNGRRRGASGSAVVLSSDGYLLTSAHVVAGAHGGEAVFTDGTTARFAVVGADALSDLAVLRVDASVLQALPLGDADRLRIGQLVVAVGNPMGYGGTVTAGVVSGLRRSLAAREGEHVRLVEDVVQTDAALNPGNSGGALVDSRARLVGVNTAVAGVGLGLAVPVNATTQAIIASLIAEGRVRRAYLGLAGAPRLLSPRMAQVAGRDRGLEVDAVVPGSPADRGAVRRGDVVIALDGVPVATAGDLQRHLTAARIGRTTFLRVLRDGRAVDLLVEPVELG